MGRSHEWLSAASAFSFSFLLAVVVFVHPAIAMPDDSTNSGDSAPSNAQIEDAVSRPDPGNGSELPPCSKNFQAANKCKRNAVPCRDDLKRRCECSAASCMNINVEVFVSLLA